MARKKKEEEIIEDPFNYGGLLLLVFSGVLIFFSIQKYGVVGTIINNLFAYLIGPSYLSILITLFVWTFIVVFLKKKYKFNIWFYIGLVMLNVAITLLSALIIYKDNTLAASDLLNILKSIKLIASSDANFKGGLLGTGLLYLCLLAFDKSGAVIILVVLFALSVILIVPLGAYKTFVNGVKEKSVKLKEKHDAYLAEKKANEENNRRQKEFENKRKDSLAEDIHAVFNEDLSKDSLAIPQMKEEIEEVENVSDFSKTYFIKDELAKPINKPIKKEKVEISTAVKKGIYNLPPLSLLANISGKPSSINKNSAEVKGKKLIEILANFGIEAKLENTHIGPSVTKFEIKPDTSVKVNRIINIQDNIKMELAAKTIRIEAPIPGRSAVGVEIPNAETVTVRMSELMKGIPEKYVKSKLMFTLGKDLMGKPVYCELNKMPHLLVAGATGSGKSVCMNTIITSYLLRSNPDDLKLVLVDPKKVEFTPYHDIPHLLWPVITDTNLASMMLKKAVVIMEERYDAFAEVGVRDIASFNDFVDKHNASIKEGESLMKKLPYIVIIIDELADLMAVAKKDVELSIQRLTQLSRACGMHLIVATQRPSTDVITGLIKSNIPSRISFAVSSSIDSRTILDQTGAEKLLGYGDMLYMPQGESAPIRIQGCFVTDEEIRKITDYVKKQAVPEYDDTYFELMRNNEASEAFSFTPDGTSAKDSMYDEALAFVKESQKASTSLLQRRFGIGYNRAARIIDQLEKNGIIGPTNGSKPREVYIREDE